METASSFGLEPLVVEAFDKVWESTYPVYALHKIDLRDLMEKNEFCHGESLVENVELHLIVLRYNVSHV